MKRLTSRYSDGTPFVPNFVIQSLTNWMFEVIKKLAHYEDLEEEGKLLHLPCPIGHPVFCLPEGLQCKHRLDQSCWNCLGDEVDNNCFKPDFPIEEFPFEIEMLEEIGERVFLTYKEAENKQKERKVEWEEYKKKYEKKKIDKLNKVK